MVIKYHCLNYFLLLCKNNGMPQVLTEITPLSSVDCFYVVDRYKDKFDYPIHCHEEFELNFVKGAAGAVRVVGDCIESIGDLDLALIGSGVLEHTWIQGECRSGSIREITIQFHPDFFSPWQLGKNQFASIRRMLNAAKNGISFPESAIRKAFPIIEQIVANNDGFNTVLSLMCLLNVLSKSEYKILSSKSFARYFDEGESRRVRKVKEYIDLHYSEKVTLDRLAQLVGMTPTAFSRFFRKRTGRPLIEYILDVRLGAAARLLVDTSSSVAEICYETGFNNLSNFNRAFRRHKGMSPREFRQMFRKQKFIV